MDNQKIKNVVFKVIKKEILKISKKSTVFVSTDNNVLIIRSVYGIKSIPFEKEHEWALHTYINLIEGHNIIKF